jgi:hypothetical protein
MRKEFTMKETIDLNTRRLELQMPIDILAKRAKVSAQVVDSILSQQAEKVPEYIVEQVSNILGIRQGQPMLDTDDFRYQRAKEKAKLWRTMVQGTMALEDQAVSSETMTQLEIKTIEQLLAGDARNLWCE